MRRLLDNQMALSWPLLLAGLVTIPPAEAGTFTATFAGMPTDVCFGDQTQIGALSPIFDGYGCTMIESNGIESTSGPYLHMMPASSRYAGETHAALVLGPTFSGHVNFRGKLYTVRQLRRKTLPNPWEVAWIIWHYVDNDHFYYFIPKPNGWELGKRDPAYPGGQRFLATGISPRFPIKQWYDFRISHQATGTVTVAINGLPIVEYTDKQRPYLAGNIGLYNEDAHVHFADIAVTQ